MCIQASFEQCRWTEVTPYWLIDIWHGLQQTVIDSAANEWRKRLKAYVCARGRHLFWTLSMTDENLTVKELIRVVLNFVCAMEETCNLIREFSCSAISTVVRWTKCPPHYTPCPEKKSLEYFRYNFVKYWPIFEILSLLESAENLQ